MSTDDPHWASEKLRVIEQRLSEAKGSIARLKAEHHAAALMTGDRRYQTLRKIEKQIEQAEIHRDKLDRDLQKLKTNEKKQPKAVKAPSRRDEQIYSVIKKGLKGTHYAAGIDGLGFRPPRPWRDRGCPSAYPQAYNAGKLWRARMSREKYQIKKRVEAFKNLP